MSGNEREGLREAVAEIVADHCIDYQGCSGKHEHASLQIADEILALLTQAQEPVIYLRRKMLDAILADVAEGEYGTVADVMWIGPDDEDVAVRDLAPLYTSPVASAPGSDNVRKTTDPDTFLTFPASAPEEERERNVVPEPRWLTTELARRAWKDGYAEALIRLRATPTEEQEREDAYRSDRQDMADAEYGGER